MRRVGLLILLCACPKPPPVAGGPHLPPETPDVPASAPAAPPEPDPGAGRTDLIQPPPPAPAQPVALPPVTRFVLPNGLTVLLVEDKSLPVVSLDLAVRAGTLDETREKRSLAAFAAAMLTRGAGRRSADQIAEAIDAVGGTLRAEAGLEWTRISCQTLARDAAVCLSLLPDVALSPTFPEAEMRQVREELEASVRRARDDPRALAAEHFENALWGDEHVRGWPITVDTIAAVRPKDLKDWHKTWFRPGSAVLAVSGDFDARAMRARLAGPFGRWARGEAPARKEWPVPAVKGMRVRLVDKPEQTQSQIIVGRAGASVLDPDWLASELVAYTLGEGAFSSRLMKVVRAEGGKTYGADAGFETSRVVGAFRARTATRNAETMATLRLVVEEIAKMKALGPTADELAAAQANLGGAHLIGLQNGSSVARAILSAETLGLGEAFVRELPVRVAGVTLEQAKAAARDNLSGEDLVVVIVGRASEVAPQLAKVGLPVETFSWLDSPSKRDKKPSAVDPLKAAQARKLLDAALAAKGGEARLRALKDVIGKGTVKIVEGGRTHEGPFVRFHAPGQALRLDVTTPKGKLAFIVTAAGAWIAVDDRLAQELPRELSTEQFAALWRDRDTILLRHLEADVTAETTGREKLAGKEHDVVVLKKGELVTKLFLDPRTRLLVRMEYRERNATQIEEYRDYRAVQGIHFAFRQHGEGAGQVIDAVTTEIRVNAGIPAGTFDKPPK